MELKKKKEHLCEVPLNHFILKKKDVCEHIVNLKESQFRKWHTR